jgi:hypothetical protein
MCHNLICLMSSKTIETGRHSLNADGSPVSILLSGLIRPYVLGCGLTSCQCDCVVCCGCARPGTK